NFRVVVDADDEDASPVMRGHFTYERTHSAEVVRNDIVAQAPATCHRLERAPNKARREDDVLPSRDDAATLIREQQIAAAVDRQTAWRRSDDLDERVRVDIEAFANQACDREISIQSHVDSRENTAPDSGNSELHQLAHGKWSGRIEPKNLPLVQ